MPAKRATSLDTKKQVETSVAEWMRQQETPRDVWREKWALHAQLTRSVDRIWQHYERASRAATDVEERKRIAKLSNRWAKTAFQLRNCQSQWVGYGAKCCGTKTVPIAIPIGCNHRLCPLCCHMRSQRAQKRVRRMFDRLTHPALITLTIPNLPTIQKRNYELFRKRVRQFIGQHSAWILGGVYSLETTYNRKDRTWHIHVHILADLASPLPRKDDKVKLAGEEVYRFTAIKWRLEFDWLRLWNSKWGRKPRKDCKAQVRNGDEYDFEQWVLAKRKHSTIWAKLWTGRNFVLRADLSARERERYEAMSGWNARNTRVVDLKPVIDRNGAAKEVLKYITKVAMFSDLPEAIEPFVDAVKGARLIQTFGTWYGIKLDDPEEDAEERKESLGPCTCGCRDWKRIGIFFSRDVQFDPDERWRLRAPHDHNSRGTVPRPTIRALSAREA